MKSKLSAANGNESIAARISAQRSDNASAFSRPAAAVNIAADRSVPVTRQPLCANGTAFRPAPHPMSMRRAEDCSAATATDMSDSFGGDWTNPSTVRGSLHEDPASGSRSPRRPGLLAIMLGAVVQRIDRTSVEFSRFNAGLPAGIDAGVSQPYRNPRFSEVASASGRHHLCTLWPRISPNPCVPGGNDMVDDVLGIASHTAQQRRAQRVEEEEPDEVETWTGLDDAPIVNGKPIVGS